MESSMKSSLIWSQMPPYTETVRNRHQPGLGVLTTKNIYNNDLKSQLKHSFSNCLFI